MLRAQGSDCATGPSRPYVTTDRPTFSARNSDSDTGQQSLSTRFYWWRGGQPPSASDYVTGSSANPGTAHSGAVPPEKALEDGAVYRYRSWTTDGIDATWSRVCEFRAWLTSPEPPSGVTSSDYPEYDPVSPGTGSGAPGIAGEFTISPPASGSEDVAGYAYTLETGVPPAAAAVVAKASDGSATVSIGPERTGLNVLRVWTKDVAGLFSPAVEYWFLVRSGGVQAAHWVFENPQDPGEDDTGHGNTLTLDGATTAAGRASVGTALALDGVDDRAQTTGPLTQPHPDTADPLVIRTDSTFAVAAWVRADELDTTAQVAVSAGGSQVSPFLLGYDGSQGRWQFAMAEADTASTSLAVVHSDDAPVEGRWTHLAATYASAAGTLRLYVNGEPQSATASLSDGFDGAGPVVVGHRTWGGSPDAFFDGLVDDVQVFRYIPSANAFRAAARPLPPALSFPDGDTVPAGGVLRVRMDAGGDTNVTGFRYSAGSDAIDQSVTLDAPGGTVTVDVPAVAPGELPFVAAAVDLAGIMSDSASVVATVAGDPELSGVVYDVVTFQPVPGAVVVLESAGLSTVTGADGSYSSTGLTPGTYTLMASQGGSCGKVATTTLELETSLVMDLFLLPAQDDFGYSCQAVPDVPFTPISGSPLGLSGDDATAQVSLPFSFPFYGEERDTARVDTNGLVSFDDPGGSHPASGSGIPSPGQPNALIAAFWADLVVDSQASVLTASQGTAPLRIFTIEWRNVHLRGDPSARLDVQVVLWEGGHVTIHYGGLDTAAEQGQVATVGLEAPDGQIGLQFSHQQAILSSDLQVVFVYPEFPG